MAKKAKKGDVLFGPTFREPTPDNLGPEEISESWHEDVSIPDPLGYDKAKGASHKKETAYEKEEHS